jgi:hypothetical protein
MAKRKTEPTSEATSVAVEVKDLAPEDAAPELTTPTAEEASEEKDLAVEAYALFCERQSEGDFPAWAELPEQTQKLWRDGYRHVADGGEPRTDYEEAVKYLIVSAQ